MQDNNIAAVAGAVNTTSVMDVNDESAFDVFDEENADQDDSSNATCKSKVQSIINNFNVIQLAIAS